jgi:hypothetical protein
MMDGRIKLIGCRLQSMENGIKEEGKDAFTLFQKVRSLAHVRLPVSCTAVYHSESGRNPDYPLPPIKRAHYLGAAGRADHLKI